MNTLLYLVPALGCGLMMVACMALMGRMHRGPDTQRRDDDIAELRAEVARLRAEREAAEVSDTDG